MTALAQAAVAYGHVQTHIRTPRGTEYEAIAKVTRALKSTAAHRDKRFPDFVAALQANRRLWIHLAASVADADNKLDPTLRARLFFLAEFTEEHSRKVLHESASTDILVEINSGVMRGLTSEGSTS